MALVSVMLSVAVAVADNGGEPLCVTRIVRV
jgi:hypothetical protein